VSVLCSLVVGELSLQLTHERIALRQINDGGVVKLNWCYLNRGTPVLCFLPSVFTCLINRGIATLGDPEPTMAAARRVSLTPDGRALHATECGPSSSPSHFPPRGVEPDPTGRQHDTHAPDDVRSDPPPEMPTVY
ncbi:MAG: hypothetical protein LC808_29525, partial [Actinobacteria bacterium]|nr:hypothetical protein [Actinomycetota bacterium]